MHLIPIQITLQAANAADARQLIHDLAGTMAVTNTVSTVAPENIFDRYLKAIPDAVEVAPVDLSAAAAETLERFKDAPKEDKPSTEAIPTDVELRALASEKAKSAGREKVKALLEQYKTSSISGVPGEKRVAFKADLEAL